jgi:dethiobiotin synthetase
MTQHLFITGTDTHVGKTTFAVGLLNYLKSQGKSAFGFKPISSGCELTPDGLRNADALALQAASSLQLPYDHINPFTFQEPIAPHIAAEKVGVTLSAASIIEKFQALPHAKADVIITEGAGGWLLPLHQRETLADVVQTLKMPVILVVGIRLGCLNHALLTADNIAARGLELRGWVANLSDPVCLHSQANIETLRTRLAAPLLGTIPFETDRRLSDFICPVAHSVFHE